MSIKFRKDSNNIYSLWDSSSKVTTPSLCHRKNGTTYYTPLLTSRSQIIGDYDYSASSPTVCVRQNGTTYYAAKSRTNAYNIPAGTYTPSDFESLIRNYVSQNSRRKITGHNFSVIVNGKSIVTSDTDVYVGYYTQTNGSNINGTFRYIQFSPSSELSSSERSYLGEKDIARFEGLYVVYSDGSSFRSYASYPIQITSGLKFE